MKALLILGQSIQGAFKTGQTEFETINHDFVIREGTMPVKDFTLVSSTANLIANGEVSFFPLDDGLNEYR